MIQIDELKLRIPGINEEEGSAIGRLVAEKVAAMMPVTSGNHYIRELNIQIDSTLQNDSNHFSDHIAEQIIRQLKIRSL